MASMTRTCLLACTVLVLAAAVAVAAPSFRGYTGLLIIPTADSLGEGDWNIGLSSEDASDTVHNYFGNYGLSEGLEVGINSRQPIDASEDETIISGKFQFMPETDARPAVAAGIIDLTDEEQTTAYVVASKSLGTVMGTYEGEVITPRVHVGFGGGQFSSLFVGGTIWLGRSFQIMTEWDSDNWHAGARLRLTPGLAVSAGFFDIGDGTYFGLQASFGRHY